MDHENISVSKTVREQHGKDESHHTILPPEVVVWPTCTQQVSGIAAACYKNKIPMIPFGSGTGLEGGIGAVEVHYIEILLLNNGQLIYPKILLIND